MYEFHALGMPHQNPLWNHNIISQFNDTKLGPIAYAAMLVTSLLSLRLMQIGEFFTSWQHIQRADRMSSTKTQVCGYQFTYSNFEHYFKYKIIYSKYEAIS